ncbi:hypothetical protein GCM10007884_07640 [Methylobacterium brachythecii]|uniref:Uncharacterized protein n=2 Tax=Methylobacterium brachythecii TaxID=1176177 RepID=A0ABQ6CXD1_9HYPH|nr:hypothetical protein GCM10007884_07640 [Methylobacterium brachythecii]
MQARLHNFWELDQAPPFVKRRRVKPGILAMTSRIILGAALGFALTSSAFAQSYTAPAGIPTATAPGGLEGSAFTAGANAGRGYRVAPDDTAYTTGSVRKASPDRSRQAR